MIRIINVPALPKSVREGGKEAATHKLTFVDMIAAVTLFNDDTGIGDCKIKIKIKIKLKIKKRIESSTECAPCLDADIYFDSRCATHRKM